MTADFHVPPAVQAVLENIDVVCATCIGCGMGPLDSRTFPFIVIDEAAQAWMAGFKTAELMELMLFTSKDGAPAKSKMKYHPFKREIVEIRMNSSKIQWLFIIFPIWVVYTVFCIQEGGVPTTNFQ